MISLDYCWLNVKCWFSIFDSCSGLVRRWYCLSLFWICKLTGVSLGFALTLYYIILCWSKVIGTPQFYKSSLWKTTFGLHPKHTIFTRNMVVEALCCGGWFLQQWWGNRSDLVGRWTELKTGQAWKEICERLQRVWDCFWDLWVMSAYSKPGINTSENLWQCLKINV